MWAFNTANVFDKIKVLRQSTQLIMDNKIKVKAPDLPARDVLVLDFKQHPDKKGFSSKEGQARMLHDLASIELQAMELGLRSLLEYPEMNQQFKDELLALTLSESEHLEMCLTEIENLGFKWGDWPINCGLWSCVSKEDSILDRLLIVHRYLEGSGLDSGDTLIRRLAGVDAKPVQKAVQIINQEEIGHVQFGSRWYEKICLEQKLNPKDDFIFRMDKFKNILPKRFGKINHELRLKAGFTINEINYLENLRSSIIQN